MQALKKKVTPIHLLLISVLACQMTFWQQTKTLQPDLGIVPEVPGKQAVEALSFGDKQFYFRVLAHEIQNAGDTFGRFTSLRYYDFSKLYLWFKLLDTLDSRSDMVPSMATYYFSQTQNTADVRYIVDYLYDHSTRDVGSKWWWLLQSIYLAMHRLEDKDLAIKVAKPMLNKDVPVWAQQMVAVVYEKRGEMEAAFEIMNTIKDNAKDIPDKDLNYMVYFVKERLKRLDDSKKFAPEKKPESEPAQ